MLAQTNSCDLLEETISRIRYSTPLLFIYLLLRHFFNRKYIYIFLILILRHPTTHVRKNCRQHGNEGIKLIRLSKNRFRNFYSKPAIMASLEFVIFPRRKLVSDFSLCLYHIFSMLRMAAYLIPCLAKNASKSLAGLSKGLKQP